MEDSADGETPRDWNDSDTAGHWSGSEAAGDSDDNDEPEGWSGTYVLVDLLDEEVSIQCLNHWDNFLRRSTPEQIVEDMKIHMQQFGVQHALKEDDYDRILRAVARYQLAPQGGRQGGWHPSESDALVALIFCERMYEERSIRTGRELYPSNQQKASPGIDSSEKVAMSIAQPGILPWFALVSKRVDELMRGSSLRSSTIYVVERIVPRAPASMGSYSTAKDFETLHAAMPARRFPKARPEIENGPPPTPGKVEASQLDVPNQTNACYFIAVLGFLVISGSSTVALVFSIKLKRMQDGFSAAGYMLGVGTAFLGSWMAVHCHHCNCWQRWRWRRKISSSDDSYIALVPIKRS